MTMMFTAYISFYLGKAPHTKQLYEISLQILWQSLYWGLTLVLLGLHHSLPKALVTEGGGSSLCSITDIFPRQYIEVEAFGIPRNSSACIIVAAKKY